MARKKEAGKVKSVAELSDREKRRKCKFWRKAQQQSRERKKRVASLVTPPQSPEENPQPGPSRLDRV